VSSQSSWEGKADEVAIPTISPPTLATSSSVAWWSMIAWRRPLSKVAVVESWPSSRANAAVSFGDIELSVSTEIDSFTVTRYRGQRLSVADYRGRHLVAQVHLGHDLASEITWKVAVWYFATTGAILTYFFSHIAGPDARPLLFVLLFLRFASLGVGNLHFRGPAIYTKYFLGWNTSPCLCAFPAGRTLSSLQPFLLINSVLYTAVSAASRPCLRCVHHASSRNDALAGRSTRGELDS
jgi:hypothetical protein